MTIKLWMNIQMIFKKSRMLKSLAVLVKMINNLWILIEIEK